MFSSAGKAESRKCLKDILHRAWHMDNAYLLLARNTRLCFQVDNSREAADGIFHVTPVGHGKLIGEGK